MNVIRELPASGGVKRPTDTRLSMRAEYKTALQHVATEAAGIAGAAANIVAAAQEALEKGNPIAMQQQLHFITGAYARLLKDAGIVEHLQLRLKPGGPK